MTSTDFAKAFQRNCPGVRLTKDEQRELYRLFWECQKWAANKAKQDEV